VVTIFNCIVITYYVADYALQLVGSLLSSLITMLSVDELSLITHGADGFCCGGVIDEKVQSLLILGICVWDTSCLGHPNISGYQEPHVLPNLEHTIL
jgi:hypothetical protein